MQKAEEFAHAFAARIDQNYRVGVDDVALIVADRNAMALAVLDELVARVCGRPNCDCWTKVVEQVLREKYTTSQPSAVAP